MIKADLEVQRSNILSAVKAFSVANSQNMLIFPPGDKVEIFMIHAATDECENCTSHTFLHDRYCYAHVY